MKRRPPAAAKVQLGRFFRTVLPALAIIVAGIVLVLGILVYKISNPEATPEGVNPSHYLLPSLAVSIPSGGRYDLAGYWIPGLKNAPGIVLAPGYGMTRADALSLAVALHQNGFNLLVYNPRGSGTVPQQASTLGLYEADDMSGAIRFLHTRPECDGKKLGIWGVDIGARAALIAAAEFPEIRAIAADSAFDDVSDFLSYRIAEDFGLENRLVQIGCYQIFKLAHPRRAFSAEERVPLQALSDRTVLFIKGENRKGLASLTTALYDRVLPQKEIVSFKTSRIHLMSGEELRSYDRQIASFFKLNLH